MEFSFKRFYLETIGKIIPSDVFSARHVISVKGICFIDDKVVLLKNERNEWDLPGGKLKKKENIQACLRREIEEELNIIVTVEHLLDVTKMNIMNTIEVVIMVYLCNTQCDAQHIKISQENFDIGRFGMAELSNLNIQPDYRRLILRTHQELQEVKEPK